MLPARAALLASLLILALSPAADAWIPNGIPVAQLPAAQGDPILATDENGGAFVAWQDLRSKVVEVYLQHLMSDGSLVPGWPLNGLAVTNEPVDQQLMAAIADGGGGVLLGWVDPPVYGVHVQRLTATGAVAPGWPAAGVQVAPMKGDQILLVADGAGGVYVAWQDQRTGYRAMLQHLREDGTPAPGWPVTGLLLADTTVQSGNVRPVADGSGGVVVLWAVRTSSPDWLRIFAQRLESDGTRAPGWPSGGVVVCGAVGIRGLEDVVNDGQGGVLAVWADYRLGNADYWSDIYGTRLRGDGTLAPGWPVDGLPLCQAPDEQVSAVVCGDGTGGLLAAWVDYRATYVSGVFVTHVDSTGSRVPGWPVDGQLVAPQSGFQLDPRIATDMHGGAYLAWTDYTGMYKLFAQHLSAQGQVASGWLVTGTKLSTYVSEQQHPWLIADGAGGAILAWDEGRDIQYNYDIYAQKFVSDGPVPVAVSLVSAEVVGDAVHLVWQLGGASPGLAYVERRTETSSWSRLGEASADGTGRINYVDPDVLPGTRYGYRLVLSDAASSTSSETWVEVPALRFALAGAVPNPARGTELKVAFTLAEPGAVHLEILDVTGRAVRESDPGVLEPGRHLLPLPGAALSPGVYWLRLRQGIRVATARAVVVE